MAGSMMSDLVERAIAPSPLRGEGWGGGFSFSIGAHGTASPLNRPSATFSPEGRRQEPNNLASKDR